MRLSHLAAAAARLILAAKRWPAAGTVLASFLPVLSGPLCGQTHLSLADEHFAVIVHPATAENDLSIDDLRRVFLGQQTTWPDGGRVILFVQPAGTAAGDAVLRHVYRMSETEYKHYWIARALGEDAGSSPKLVSGPALTRRLTAAVPGAIALIPAAAVDSTVKVLSVDRRFPGTTGYPLTSGNRD